MFDYVKRTYTFSWFNRIR